MEMLCHTLTLYHLHTHTAQRKQREATKQEAIVLDEEIERIQSTAQTKLQQEVCNSLLCMYYDYIRTSLSSM